jgi:peptide deformylase
MAILTVLEYPDKRLRNKALPVTEFNADLRGMVSDMFETMYHENGVGLASIQVNIRQRIIAIDISENKSAPICAINPEIIHQEGIQYEFEGCISFPSLFDKVERAAKVRLRAQDQDGKTYELDAEGLLAVCIQHEIDHLNGILFIDHLSRLKQDRLCKKLEKSRSRTVES